MWTQLKYMHKYTSTNPLPPPPKTTSGTCHWGHGQIDVLWGMGLWVIGLTAEWSQAYWCLFTSFVVPWAGTMNRSGPGPWWHRLLCCQGPDAMSFCNPNFLFAKLFPGILLLRQPEWRDRLKLDMGWGHGRPEKQKKKKKCLNLLSWSHCCLYWRCGDCINKASLFLKVANVFLNILLQCR